MSESAKLVAMGKRATYEDLLSLPEDVRAEVIAGEVLMSPSLLPRHAKVQRAIGRFVGGPEARVLEAFALEDGRWVEVGRCGDEDVARIPPFDAIELEVGRLFPPE